MMKIIIIDFRINVDNKNTRYAIFNGLVSVSQIVCICYHACVLLIVSQPYKVLPLSLAGTIPTCFGVLANNMFITKEALATEIAN